MTAKIVRIEADVAGVLARGQVTGDVFTLPPGQLDPKFYQRVNRALEALGGKWSRKHQGHTVPAGFAEKLAEALGAGQAVNADKMAGFFSTPPEVADRVAALAEVGPDHLLLEPSAGDGALLRAVERRLAHLPWTVAVENDEGRARGLVQIGWKSVEVVWSDFLAWARSIAPDSFAQRFDRIVMNPPFSRGIEAQHVLAALTLLKPEGRLVAILPPMVQDREDRHHDALRAELNRRPHRWIPLPEGSFKVSGTNVQTCILVVG